ncbi:UDP-4-amino-4,6-dideoxy-N-acetyl-beta-L-altrosamine transaminase [Helicobacter sp. 12S02634-8]|uniref:UDP-4-amino-4, 6-dideoxy-N-acetyl-beta-L-altrosamine transaminase n=1 Tax=Helicobacter sp. 12S02634-8 TaxID=1476199 RepID=UPI000BA6BA87|nr:UDP-4-amino-4,6-dideoxy-N-acetyl-beta-L-altrosamine transaminase [Helicobacter sp. 12S02634-8]PAF47570.1 UDP-4-amino-4,6-dideoxy-N-acetyl-beta-L-altrosamine transaminase [Helicobacter sp. 12S02634-8]
MIPYSTQCIQEDDIKAVLDALQSPNLTQGKYTQEFEDRLCAYLGVKYALVFNSATSALYSAYQAANIQSTHQVITSPISFVATSNMLLECGALPVFCDVKRDGNINERLLSELITPTTKAIVSVDYAGNSVEADKIREICADKHLTFISDSSHAIGAYYHNRRIGTLADMTIFSFHAIKPITTAEGGALVTDCAEFYEQAKLVRSHGMVKKDLWNSEVTRSGFNFRMTELQAALGISQLKKLDQFLQIREEIAQFYDQAFQGNPYFFTLHQNMPHTTTNHLYPIILAPEFWCAKEEIFKALLQSGLGVQVHYKPIYQFSLYQKLLGDMQLANANDFYRAEISIPCHQKMDLRSAKDCTAKILKVFEKFKACVR